MAGEANGHVPRLDESAPVTVTIGVATFHRVAELARLLPLLGEQADAVVASGLVSRAEVLVVDNDKEGSARPVVEAAPTPVSYVVEPRPGVAAARNRILDEASGDLLVFIDDDETPKDRAWLARLLGTLHEFDAQAVSGKVEVVTLEEPDPWIVAGGFGSKPHRAGFATGRPIERAATNNLLLDLRFVRRSGVRFDDRFGRSGGEDSLFTSQLHAAGARLVWDAEAVVLDHRPRERQRRDYVVRSLRAMASAGVRVNVALADTAFGRLKARARGLLAGSARVVVGAGGVAAGKVIGSMTLDAVGTREFYRGSGAISGSLGRVTLAYGSD